MCDVDRSVAKSQSHSLGAARARSTFIHFCPVVAGTHPLLCTHLVLCRALVVQGLAFYDDFFGVSYPFGKYDQLFVPEFNQVRRTPPPASPSQALPYVL